MSVSSFPERGVDDWPTWLRDWFAHTFGEPTPIQQQTWRAVRTTPHLLLSAATGTGKTLAALLPVVADLLQTRRYSGPRALYVAPLKALVQDTARNLDRHLADLAEFLPADLSLPRLAVRTGDTSASDRRQLLRDPADLLLTTPESLAVLLSGHTTAELLADVRWVIVDEVHALVGNKRGADLALSLERLEALATSRDSACAGLRRFGLSATATPLSTAASWLAGVDRTCQIVRAADSPAPELRVEPLPPDSRFFSALVSRLTTELPQYRAVLLFCNTRSLAERLAWALRRALPGWEDRLAVHHSALAADRRRDIERRFKRGELRAVVCSTSLELGIDVGSVQLVVLIHPPGDVVRLLQRVGRAGHDPEGISRGLVLTASPGELLEAAVTCASGLAGQCEPLTVPDAPLDVLCQHLLGLCCVRPWTAEQLYALIRRATPYAHLSRRDFDDCLTYLSGRDQQGANWLPARLVADGDCWVIAGAATARLVRRNLGTILTDPTLCVVRRESAPVDPDALTEDILVPIGEVDESFADRLEPGDRFLLDGRCLEFRARQEVGLVVEEVVGRPRPPVWIGEGWPLSRQLAARLYVLRQQAAEALREGPSALRQLLSEDYGLNESAADLLAGYFLQQEAISEIPDAATLLIEIVPCEAGMEYVLHTPLNRLGNEALARVAVSRLASEQQIVARATVADLGFALQVRCQLSEPAELFRQLLRSEGFREQLDAALQQSELLRHRFARVARTGLMLLRNPRGRRRRVGGADWPQRQLFDQVRRHDADFVLIRQALREIREACCDASAALAWAEQLPLLTVRCRVLSAPSPFAAAWTQRDSLVSDLAEANPAEALARLHAELMGSADAGVG